MLPPRSSATRKPALTNTTKKTGLTSTVKKSSLREVKEVDPDEITDEMMDMAYARWITCHEMLFLYFTWIVFFRYIQAAYIDKKCREARIKAEEDAKKQILKAFFATEELRIEVWMFAIL